MVRSGFCTAWRLATAPTGRSPSSVNATTEGVVRPPSSFVMTTGWPPSITATTEFVVPRSIPMILPESAIALTCLPSPGPTGRGKRGEAWDQPPGRQGNFGIRRPARERSGVGGVPAWVTGGGHGVRRITNPLEFLTIQVEPPLSTVILAPFYGTATDRRAGHAHPPPSPSRRRRAR